MGRALAADDGQRLVDRRLEDAELAVSGRRCDVWRHDDIVPSEERVIHRQRLGLRDVQPGSG